MVVERNRSWDTLRVGEYLSMEQHPIPQNISSYQFRLVGDMTLKQFFQLAGGIVVGLIFYSSPLLPIIKWPFAIVSVILGVALAFLPLEERPLEKWIISFFKAIYSPTLYYWKKGDLSEKIFQDEPLTQTAPIAEEEIEKFSGVKKIETPLSKLEAAEKGFLGGLMSIFSNLIPNASTSEGSIRPPSEVSVGLTPEVGTTTQPFQVPLTQPVKIAQEVKPRVVVEEAPQAVTSQVAPILAGEEMVSTKQAIFSVDAAPPNPPVAPNIVVGQVIDMDRKIIEGAILEIKDSNGRPVRALKSNKAGHFIIVTPLQNGKYEISTEKDGFTFEPVSFETKGEIIPAIAIRGVRN